MILSDLLNAFPTPLQRLDSELLTRHGVTLSVKRLDLVHPVVSGNKWYKLKYNLHHARQQGFRTILSFGGAYSNHIHALAGACAELGLNSIGVIRGEPHHPLNPTLQFAKQQGMQLHYISRSEYRDKQSPQLLAALTEQFGDFYLVPEGGSNSLALKGVAELVDELGADFDVLCCACGSGGTLAGLIAGLRGKKLIEGYVALKGGGFLSTDIRRLLRAGDYPEWSNWTLQLDYHFGGFAKTTPQLLQFMRQFEVSHNIPLEPLYTAKMFYGLFERIERGVYPSGTHVIALHSGGLQGRDSLLNRESNN